MQEDPFHPLSGRPRPTKLGLDSLLPPRDVRHEAQTYAHLKLAGDQEDGLETLRPESVIKQDSWRILESWSPRSPGAKRAQVFALGISGRESEKGQGTADPTLATLLPASHTGSARFGQQSGGPARSTSGDAGSLALASGSDTRSSLQSLVNTYDRTLIVLSERLKEVESLAAERPRKASSETCCDLWTRLVRDTHRLYVLLVASLVLFETDAVAHRRGAAGELDLHEFDSFDYSSVADETDYRITLKSLQRWFTTGGRIHVAFEKLYAHARAIKRQGLDVNTLHLSEPGFRKIDEAATRCLERMDAIRELLRRFDMQNATTAVIAAMRFRKLSPKQQNFSVRWGM